MSIIKYPYLLLNVMRRISLRCLGGSTLGVQALVINNKQEILLVRHTYCEGWFFPGGGVKSGESLRAAICRELQEEVGITVEPPIELYDIYHHRIYFGDDYPALFIVKHFKQATVKSIEIAEAKWFHINKLPLDTKNPVITRIQEYFFKAEKTVAW